MVFVGRLLAAAVGRSAELTRLAWTAAGAATAAASSVFGARRTAPKSGRHAPSATSVLATLVRRRPSDARPAHLDEWTAGRLRETLDLHLRGRRMIVVANREPVIHEWNGPDIVVRHPASGLVTALEPVMRACSGIWVAHGSGSADRAASDAEGRVMIQGDGGAYRLRRVWLSSDEERGYYYGFANEALWPLCHLAHAAPVFRRSDWTHYEAVNRRFAEAVASEADSDEPIVLVQDYHFALLPQLLRERFPRAMILTFWHIPWPNPERFAICPQQNALLQGLLGSSIVGFQTPLHCRNFLETVDRTLEVRIEREDMSVAAKGRTTAVRHFPISVEWPNPWSLVAPSAEECRRRVRAELGLAPHTHVVLSVDRLDYSKGIGERLQTFERLLEQWDRPRGALAIIQVAAPSRTVIDRYREFGARIRTEVDRINARFADWPHPPVVFLNRHCEPPEVHRFYRAADVCYVSSLHDGMNLVAKEFVSSRDDESGVLLLSRFAGAAAELREALIVNPYDVDEVADTLMSALVMPLAEQRVRMRALREQVSRHNIYRWAGRMLIEGFQMLKREQFGRRLAGTRLRAVSSKASLNPNGIPNQQL